MRNIKLTIEYDGKCYNGWQKQPTKLNIQGTIEKAIEESKKCVLLCSNCHKEFHAELQNLNELDFNEKEEVELDSNP